MKNSGIKRKKMSLNNIEGKLTTIEMEKIMAGSGFGDGFCAAMYIGAMFVPYSPIGGAAAGCFIWQAFR